MGSGSGSWGVGWGTIRLWRMALFYGSAGTKWASVKGVFSAQRLSKSTKHFHCREASVPFCLLPPTPLCDLGIMGCLGRACWETRAHFGPHSAINRSNRLVYSTQVGQPFKLPEESRTICGRNKRNTSLASVWFSIPQWDHCI